MKIRRRPWTLSPRDLPHPSAFQDEPLLQDLENNAAYRMLIYRRGKVSASDTVRGLGCLLLFPLMIFIPFWIPLILMFVFFIIEAIVAPNKPGEGLSLDSLDFQRLTDLHHAGFPPEDILAAMWGARLPRTFRVRVHQAQWIVFVLVVVTLPFFIHFAWLWLAVPIAGFLTFDSVFRRYLPHTVCQDLQSALVADAFLAGGPEAARRTVAGCRRATAIFGGGTLLFIALAVAIMVSDTVPARGPDAFQSLLLSPIAVILAILVAVAIGALMGLRRGRTLLRDRDEWVRRNCTFIREVLVRVDDELDKFN